MALDLLYFLTISSGCKILDLKNERNKILKRKEVQGYYDYLFIYFLIIFSVCSPVFKQHDCNVSLYFPLQPPFPYTHRH